MELADIRYFRSRDKNVISNEKVVGIDPGLVNVGVGVLWYGRSSVHVYRSKLRGVSRLNEIAAYVQAHCRGSRVACVEGYSYGSGFQDHQLGEAGGALRIAILGVGCRLLVLPPTSLKMFVTGKGNTPKEYMQWFVQRRWGVVCKTSHEADAYGLARYGALYLAIEERRVRVEELHPKIQQIFRKGPTWVT